MAKTITSIQEEKPVQNFVDFIKRSNSLGINVIEALIFSNCFSEFEINKKTLVQNISNIQSYISFNNQGEFKFIEYDEYDFEFLQNKEKELLGVNFEYHPIHNYQDKILQSKIKVLSEVIDTNLQYLEFICIVSKVKKHKTKNGEDMAFIVCEDEFNSLDGVIFPNLYKRIKIEANKVYLVKGKLDSTKQKQSIVIDEIKPF